MKFNFKKISAIGASILMTGMSMGVAAAANFPAPYSDGASSATAIVYGAGAATTDVAAATSINTYLKDHVSDDAGAPTGESYLFEKSTDKLNIGDNLTDMKSTSIDEEEMPTILADGTYSNKENTDYNYEQKIDLSTQLQFEYFKNAEYNSETPSLGIQTSNKEYILNYTLDFTKSPVDNTGSSGDLLDFEDTTIEIMGKTYDIVDAKNSSNTLLVLMSGTTKDTLSLGESGTYTVDGVSYEVEVTYVDSDECKFLVNGEATNKLTDGAIDKLSDGTRIGVSEVDYSTGAVTEIMRCEFWMGADKIDLEDTKEVEINDVDVDNLKVWIEETTGASQEFKLDKIILEWKSDDELFIADDGTMTMPGFNTVKLSYTGLILPDEYETLKFRGNSDKEAKITVNFKSGEKTFAILGSNETSSFEFIGGKSTASSGKGLVTSQLSNWNCSEGKTSHIGDNVRNITFDFGNNQSGDEYFVATYLSGKTGESYLVEPKCDDTDGCDFKDAVTGIMLQENIKNGTSFDIGDATFTISHFYEDHYLIFNASSDVYIDRIVTAEGLIIYLPVASAMLTQSPYLNISGGRGAGYEADYILRLDEEDKDGTLGSGENINVTFKFSSDKVEATIATAAEKLMSGDDMQTDPSDDHTYYGYMESDVGSHVIYTNPDSSEDYVDVHYYGEQVYGQFYISEDTSASVAVGAMLFTDGEKSDWETRNLVLVGGSCINSATAAVLGGAYCEADFTDATGVADGQFLIESFANPDASGKVALVVAGYHAADTSKGADTLIGDEEVDTAVGSKYVGTTAMAEGSVLEAA